jgi:hypothetical protein
VALLNSLVTKIKVIEHLHKLLGADAHIFILPAPSGLLRRQ